jgi:membrane protease YdiL (CAAX protease family)
MSEGERGAEHSEREDDEAGSQMSLWPAGGEVQRKEDREQETDKRVLRAGQDDRVEDAGLHPALAAGAAWTLMDLGAFVLFAAFALPAAFFATAAVFVGLRAIFGWETTVDEAFMRAPVIVAMQTLWEVFWLGFIFFTVTIKYRREFWDAMRWTRGAGSEIHAALRPRNWLATGAVLALAAQLYFYIAPTENELPIERLFASPGAGYVLMLFGILVAPFVEEMVFRGFFFPVFEQRWGLGVAVLLTALLFAVIHASQLWGGWEEITAIFVVGLAFSYVRGRTGSLMPSYLMHLGYNTALFVSLYLSTDGFRTLDG